MPNVKHFKEWEAISSISKQVLLVYIGNFFSNSGKICILGETYQVIT